MRSGYVRAAMISLLTGGFLTLGVLTSLHDSAVAASSSTAPATTTGKQCQALPATASSLAVTFPVILAIPVTFGDALSHPVSQSLRDEQRSRERRPGVAFPVGFPPADAAGPVLAVGVAPRDLCLAVREVRHP